MQDKGGASDLCVRERGIVDAKVMLRQGEGYTISSVSITALGYGI
jgi:hypothetical protein